MQSQKLTIFFGLVTMLMLPGCYSTWDIAPRDLIQLHGFRSGTPQTISEWEGKEVARVDEDTTFIFEAQNGQTYEGQFVEIKILENRHLFHGVSRRSMHNLFVDIDRLRRVQVTQVSPVKTAFATTGVIAIVPATVMLVIAGIWL